MSPAKNPGSFFLCGESAVKKVSRLIWKERVC